MSKEAMRLALEGAANYIDALGGDSRKYRQALAEQPAQQEPVAWMTKTRSVWKTKADETDAPLYTSPPAQRTWVGLIRGVRVYGDTVVIAVKGGNDAARELCGALLKETT